MLILGILVNIGQPITAVATDTLNNVVVTVDNDEERIAEGLENGYKFIAILNKKANTIELRKLDIKNEKILDVNLYDLNKKDNTEDIISNNDDYAPMAGKISQNTFSNYEYTKWFGSPNKWELRRPREGFGFNNTYYFQTNENSQNRSYLNSFYDTVENINSLEKEYLTFVSLEILTGTLGAIFSGGLGTFLAAAGLSGQAVNIAWRLDRECRDAENNYWEVYNKR